MKKLLFFATMLSMALFSCTSDDEGNVVGWKPGAEPVISSMLKANFNGGSMIVSSTGYLQSKGMLLSRALGDYTGEGQCGNFAWDARSVEDLLAEGIPTLSLPTTVAPFYETKTEYYNKGTDYESSRSWEEFLPLETGKNYVITADNYDKIKDQYFTVTVANPFNGYVEIYVSGVNMPKALNTGGENSYIRYHIMNDAELTWGSESSTLPLLLENHGTLNLPNGASQSKEGGNGNIKSIENYATLNIPNNQTLLIDGYFVTNKPLNSLVKGAGTICVKGNFNATDGFGFGGELYVSGEMSGNLNINTGLRANVGSVNTDGAVVVTSGSQLYVRGDVAAASMQLDGADDKGDAAECVILGSANITGNVKTASGTKGYIEKLECQNYTANASDIWVGCKSDVAEKFELNGNSKFTMANGVYVHAKNAVFASNTQMVMMDNAYFKVDEILQINNVGDNGFNGVGTKMAVVQADKIGANNEDFINTFTGNVGVEFNGWNYDTSTGLIDNCTNLPRLGELQNSADSASIANSDCNPGFTGSKVPTTPPAVEPVKTTYEVHYVVMDNGKYVDIATADTGIDANVGDNPKPGLTAKTVDGYTFSGQKNGPDALVEDAAQNKFYLIYNKNEESEQPTTPPATDPDPTPDPTPAINCGVTITLPVDIKGEWIAQADDFAIHNGDYLYENIAAGTVDVEDPNYVTDTGHNSIQNYVVVNAGERVTISIEDLCAMYEAYRGKTKICDDEKSVYFGKEVSYMDEEGIFTIETYIWPCKKTTESDGVNDVVKIYPVPASEYGVIADGVDGKYLVGGENTYETYLANNKYLVRAQAYQSYNGGGQGAAMTSYIKVTFHIQDITPKSAE